MRDALRDGGQVMLLLNRRGFSTHVHCPACGHVEVCRFCDLTLTHHRLRDVARFSSTIFGMVEGTLP